MRAIAALFLLLLPPLAHAAGHAGHAAPAWTDLPLIESVPGRDRALAAFRLRNLAADSVRAYAPGRQAPLPEGVRFKTETEEWDILAAAGRFSLQAGGVGNYHWLLAREESPESVTVASTAHYFSNPGPAPTAMLARMKSELEIVPAPLPREHNRYRENQEWDFLLRFRGEPLVGATLRFVSDSGGQATLTSGADGRIRLRFPDDVDAADGHAGHGRGAANRFVLAVEHDADGRHYLTSFNYSYAEDAYSGKSLAWGGGFLALGGLLGLPLIVRRKEEQRG